MPIKRENLVLNKRGFISLCLAALVFMACAPSVQKIERSSGEVPLGPRLQDVRLKIDPKRNVKARMQWSAQLSPHAAFRMVENILALRDGPRDSSRRQWSLLVLNEFSRDRKSIKTSPYIDLLIENSKPSMERALKAVQSQLKTLGSDVQTLTRSVEPPLKSQEALELEQAVPKAMAFLKRLDAVVVRSSLMPEAIEILRQRIAYYLELGPSLSSAAQELKNATSMQKALSSVQDVLKILRLDLEDPQRSVFQRAQDIASKTDRFNSAEEALRVLIEVWVFLDSQEREDVFKSASPELYQYLAGMSERDMACARTPGCSTLSQSIAQSWVIYPKLKAFGLERLRSLLNSRGSEAVRRQVVKEVERQVRNLPDVFIEETARSAQVYRESLEKLRVDFADEMRTRFAKWSDQKLEASGPTVWNLKPARAQVEIQPSGSVEFAWLADEGDADESLGALSSLLARLWQESSLSESERRSVLLTQISILAGQFKDNSSFDSAKVKQLTARGLAESVRGFATQANAFHDMTLNPFDDLLGRYRASALFPEYDSPALKRAIFPKSAFYAMSFAKLSDVLASARDRRSQIFLVDTQRKVSSAGEIAGDADNTDKTAVMAGIANRDQDRFAPLVRAEDVARLLLGLCEVLKATRSIESSRAELLRTPLANGEIPRDKILAGRKPIRLLVIGLANYLSHQFRDEQNLIRPELFMSTQQPTKSDPRVLDQALSIRALLAAAEVLATDIYRWEAIDILMAMNRFMYSERDGFYSDSKGVLVSLPTLFEMLRAIDEISPWLEADSREQLRHLSAPWRSWVARLNLNSLTNQ